MAEDDPFGLNQPIRLLQEKMSLRKDDFEIQIYPEGKHDLWKNELRQHIHGQMVR